VRLELSDDILRRAEINRADVRIALAVQLYADNRIDHADACRLARLAAVEFNRELLVRDMTVQQYPAVSLGRKEAG